MRRLTSEKVSCPAPEVTFETPFVAEPKSTTSDLAWPHFWQWSFIKVPPEAELQKEQAVYRRLLRNLNGRTEHLLHFGESSFYLQSYARARSASELVLLQRDTLAGFVELLRNAPNSRQRGKALLAILVTLTDQNRRADAEHFYKRLVDSAARGREAGWAHVLMAEYAARGGRRDEADLRYALALRELAAEDGAYAFACARKERNARR